MMHLLCFFWIEGGRGRGDDRSFFLLIVLRSFTTVFFYFGCVFLDMLHLMFSWRGEVGDEEDI